MPPSNKDSIRTADIDEINSLLDLAETVSTEYGRIRQSRDWTNVGFIAVLLVLSLAAYGAIMYFSVVTYLAVAIGLSVITLVLVAFFFTLRSIDRKIRIEKRTMNSVFRILSEVNHTIRFSPSISSLQIALIEIRLARLEFFEPEYNRFDRNEDKMKSNI